MKKLILITSLLMMAVTPAIARTSCKSFDTQSEAQTWYKQRKASGQNGWKPLDRDNDGIACENLP